METVVWKSRGPHGPRGNWSQVDYFLPFFLLGFFELLLSFEELTDAAALTELADEPVESVPDVPPFARSHVECRLDDLRLACFAYPPKCCEVAITTLVAENVGDSTAEH